MAHFPTTHAVARQFKTLLASDAFGGILLIAVAILAIIVANSPLHSLYHDALHAPMAWTPVAKLNTVHLWINDGLMVVFFLVVGLEVKREIMTGSLADARSRRLPILSAIAGMAAPAIIYLSVVSGQTELESGWAIPAATDIAFAMGVIGLLGRRVPPPLRLFLLTVAIVDDIGAVLIIAVFYTAEVHISWLIGSALIVCGMVAMNRMGVRQAWPFACAAVLLWFCVLHSGVHATIAGVMAALTIPMHGGAGRNLLDVFEHALVRWNSYLIVPLFGFANAGVALSGLGLQSLVNPLPLAIAAGLLVGKQMGIFASIVLADRWGIAPRPANATWRQIWGTSVLCGIGFTMSLFIGALAFPGHPMLVEDAKLGVLTGSLLSAVLGYLILRFAPPPDAPAPK